MSDETAKSLAHMYVWAAIQEILEGATDPGREDECAAKDRGRVIAICERQQQRCLRKHDAMREEGLEEAENVRAYAHSRADVAENALAAHSAQAQPPAASVTDEMVERARSAFVRADDGSTGITDAIRAALLAAQENPNA